MHLLLAGFTGRLSCTRVSQHAIAGLRVAVTVREPFAEEAGGEKLHSERQQQHAEGEKRIAIADGPIGKANGGDVGADAEATQK